MTSEGSVGIIANPASGKDIRRLVAHGSTFDNNEKINIVRRVLLGLDSVGVARVWYMPDTYAIVPRAAAGVDLRLDLEPLPMAVLNHPGDSYEAARRMVDLGATAIVTLGGDGTNRVVAKGSGDVPLVPISTGTNNVFPRMIEGTLAGLAGGLVATGVVPPSRGVRQLPRLDVYLDGEVRDLALIDVVTSGHAWVGARALWDPAHLREVVLSRVAAAEIGICGLGGLLFPNDCGRQCGVHIVIGAGERTVVTPLAPGLIRQIPVAAASLLAPGEAVDLNAAPGTVALDGEREFELLGREQSLSVALIERGPRVVDIDAAIQAGAEIGAFRV
jgi:predicted polyphosphate/ATP-dependent NAD kinase